MPPKTQHQDTEEDSQANVERRPGGGLLQRGHMGLADVEEVVESQQGQDDGNGGCPDKGETVMVLNFREGSGPWGQFGPAFQVV